jgi:hypothetical protein
MARARIRLATRAQREVDNMQMCSGHCCGNERRHGYEGGPTRAEIKNAWKFKESIEDWKNPELSIQWEDDWPDPWPYYPYGYYDDDEDW